MELRELPNLQQLAKSIDSSIDDGIRDSARCLTYAQPQECIYADISTVEQAFTQGSQELRVVLW